MPSAYEKFGRKLNNGAEPRYESVWVVDGTDDAVVAHATLLGAVPLIVQGLYLQDVELSEQGAAAMFYGVATYGMRKIPEHGDNELQVSHRLDNERRYYGLSPSTVYPLPGTVPPDNNQVIGANAEGQPEGMDVTVPVASYSLTSYFFASGFSQGYMNGLTGIRGCVNNATFGFTWRGLTFSFLAGECLFAGFSLGTRGTDLWQITHEFEGRANRTLSIGAITGIALAGHDHLHVLWQTITDAGAPHLTPGPLAVYVSQKHPRASFTGMFP